MHVFSSRTCGLAEMVYTRRSQFFVATAGVDDAVVVGEGLAELVAGRRRRQKGLCLRAGDARGKDHIVVTGVSVAVEADKN